MFCTHCGNKLAENIKFCTTCGAAVKSGTITQQRAISVDIQKKQECARAEEDARKKAELEAIVRRTEEERKQREAEERRAEERKKEEERKKQQEALARLRAEEERNKREAEEDRRLKIEEEVRRRVDAEMNGRQEKNYKRSSSKVILNLVLYILVIPAALIVAIYVWWIFSSPYVSSKKQFAGWTYRHTSETTYDFLFNKIGLINYIAEEKQTAIPEIFTGYYLGNFGGNVVHLKLTRMHGRLTGFYVLNHSPFSLDGLVDNTEGFLLTELYAGTPSGHLKGRLLSTGDVVGEWYKNATNKRGAFVFKPGLEFDFSTATMNPSSENTSTEHFKKASSINEHLQKNNTTEKNETVSYPYIATIVVENAYLHKEPEMDAEITGLVTKGAIVSIEEKQNNLLYCKYRGSDGVEVSGWIFSKNALKGEH